MIARYREGSIPNAPSAPPSGADLDRLGATVAERLDAWDLSGALDEIWNVVRALNRYVEEQAPWQLAKDPARARELDETLYNLADGLRAVAVALAAYLPETAPLILAALAQPAELSWDNVAYGRTAAADGIVPAQPLFPRVEAEAVA
jgi:methionyl-tRNA synthetase